ncbi:hypothetical protein HOU14_gp01 [Dickeya phage Luksen]|uniref:Uncharacterized protein n=1 Tax=Dickeya phage Luksen TaxID=2320192 RepID=A0A385IGN6_9CAUD|nr:hypothetical protein HOU14_gp01 [Dickeya phage Luksen]AXY81827.1 hypothetical protein [Dickeya phage Luksen]
MLDSMFHLKDTEVAPPQTTNLKGFIMLNKRYNLNARVLGNTAQAYADRLKTDKKFTIAQTLKSWNMIVEREGKSGTYSFPTTGYTRKAQLIADLERCAVQLRELAECKDTVYDVEQAHKEALLANMPIDEQTRSRLNREEAPMTDLDVILNDARNAVNAVEAAIAEHKAGYDIRTIELAAKSQGPNRSSMNAIIQCLTRESRSRLMSLINLLAKFTEDLRDLEARILPAQVLATAPAHNKTHFVNVTVGTSRVKVKADFQMRLYPRDMSKSRLEESVSCLNEFIKNEFKFTVVSVVTTMGDSHGDLKAIVTVK